MYKIAALTRFPDGMAREDARRYWTDTHGPLGRRVPGMERYVQSHVVGPLPGGERPFFDGYACCWFADRAGYEASTSSPEWKTLEDDGPNVFDMDWLRGMVAALEERTLADGPVTPFKVVWVSRSADGLASARPALEEAGVSRYVENHVLEPVGDTVGLDGFAECWLESEEALLGLASRAWPGLAGARLEERVIKG
jgi:uncharacterized protein (TIGR02118 family)